MDTTFFVFGSLNFPAILSTTVTLLALFWIAIPMASSASLRFIFLLAQSLGFGPKETPPPTLSGDRIEPCLARPVPFCLKGLRPPPLTSERVFVEAVPARALRRSRTYLRWTTYMSFSPLVTLRFNVAEPASPPSKVLTGTSAVADAARALGRRAVGGATSAEPVAHRSATATRRIVFFAGDVHSGAQQSTAVPAAPLGDQRGCTG